MKRDILEYKNEYLQNSQSVKVCLHHYVICTGNILARDEWQESIHIFFLILIRFVEIYDHLLYVQQTEVVMRVPSNSFIIKCHLAKEGSEFEPGFYIDFRLLTLD